MSTNAERPERSDTDLMKRVQAGEGEAFAQLYLRHYAGALGVALAVCKDAHLAEDAVQEGFLSIWRGRSTYEATRGDSLVAWVKEVVRNRAIDSLRREGAGKRPRITDAEVTEIADNAAVSPLDELLARTELSEGREVLGASMRRLPAAQAEIILLAYFEELSHTQIARRLAIPEGTVKGRLRLAMEKLRSGMRVRG